MALPSAQSVIDNIKGKKWDVDNTGDFDCVDVAKRADQLYHPGIGWATTGIHGNGKDIFNNANPQYYRKVYNDHTNANQLPPVGAIICFDATPKAGYTNTYPNPYGHTGLVVAATATSLSILMQASGTGKAAWVDTHAWRYRPCQGWLIPIDVPAKVDPLKQAQAQITSLTQQLTDLKRTTADKIVALNNQVKILTNANATLKAQVGELNQWQTLRALLRTLLGIK